MSGSHHRTRNVAILLVFVAIVAQGVYFARYTGLFGFETTSATYTDFIYKNFSLDETYVWNVQNTNFETINSVKLNGNVYGGGNARVYLVLESGRLLVFDFSKVSRGAGVSVTGFAVDEQVQENVTLDESNQSYRVDETNATTQQEQLLENKTFVEFNITNVSVQELNITTLLELESNLTNQSLISYNLTNESESFNVTSETQDKKPKQEKKKEEEKQWAKEEVSKFSSVCIDTCYINETSKSYTLYIEVSGKLVLEIESISYDVIRKLNRIPEVSRIPNIYVGENGYTLNLLDFAHDGDGDRLSFSVTSLDNFDLVFDEANVTITPRLGFAGNETVWFYVSDGINETVSYGVLLLTEVLAANASNITQIKPGANISNVSFYNNKVQLVQYKAEIGKPVKWLKKVELEKESQNLYVEIPENASNIKTYKRMSDENRLDIEDKVTKYQEDKEALPEDLYEDSNNLLDNKTNGTVLYVQEVVQQLDVEYETFAPYTLEQDTSDGKIVKVVGISDLDYQDVTTYTNIDERLNLTDPRLVLIYWQEQTRYVRPAKVEDKDGNGVYDYVGWITPHLSNQTFGIIVITKAIHLSSNKTYISDIYDYVKAQDENWSETIPSGEYVRVTFERNLTSQNDITIYPRTISGSPRVEVYEKDGNFSIAQFSIITDNKYNQILLVNLQGIQDTFDLLVLDGDMQFDHIVDPKFFISVLNLKLPYPSDGTNFVNLSINDYSGDTGQGPIYGRNISNIQCNATVSSVNGNGGAAEITRLVNATDVPKQKIPVIENDAGITNNTNCANPESTTLSATGDTSFTSCDYRFLNFSKDYTIGCNSTDAVVSNASIRNTTYSFSYDDCKDNTQTSITSSRIPHGTWYSRSRACSGSTLTSPVNMVFGKNAFPHGSYNLTNSIIEITANTKTITFDVNASVIFNNVNISATATNKVTVDITAESGLGHIFNNTRFENLAGQVGVYRDNTTFENVTVYGLGSLAFDNCLGCDIDNSFINYTGINAFSSLLIATTTLTSANYTFEKLRLYINTTNPNDAAIEGNADDIQVWLNDSVISGTWYVDTWSNDVFFSGNFTFTNVTFNKSRVNSNSVSFPRANLSVYWYLDVNVTNATGVAGTSGPINNSRIEITDNQGRLVNVSYTRVNGFIDTLILKEYSQNANLQSFFMTNYTLNVSVTGPGADSCTNRSFKVNLTTNTVVVANMTCVASDAVPPNLTLFLPRNITYNNNFSVELNYTTSSDFASCWYTLNGGSSVNISCLGYNIGNHLNVSGEGGYNLMVFVNDTTGNINSTGINFTVDFCSGQENWVIDGMGGVTNASLTSLTCENKTIVLDENLTVKNYGNLTFRNITLVVNNTRWNNTILVDNFGNFTITSNKFAASMVNGTARGGAYRFIVNWSRFFIKDSFVYDAGIDGENKNSTNDGLYFSFSNINFINTTLESFLAINGTNAIIIVNSTNALFYNSRINKTGGTQSTTIRGNVFYLSNVTNSNFSDITINYSKASRAFDIFSGSNNNTFDKIILDGDLNAFEIIDSVENKIYNSFLRVSPGTGTQYDIFRLSNANNTVIKNTTAIKATVALGNVVYRTFGVRSNNITIHNSFFDTGGLSNSGFMIQASNNTYVLNSNFSFPVLLFSAGTAGTNVYILNSTFNKASISPGGANASVAWFFDVNVTGPNGVGITNANATLYDKNLAFLFSDLTGASGFTPLENVTEYTRNATMFIYNGNHTLITTYSNYPVSNISVNVTTSITVNVTFDFEATIVNISLFPTSPLTTNDLNCTFLVYDNDTTAVPIKLNLSWYRDGILGTSYILLVNNGTENSTILKSANTTKNENWTCSITPFDGVYYGPQRNASVIIQNSAPSIVTLSTPTNNNYTMINRTVLFTWNVATDADNDLLVYDIFLECFSACSDDSRVAYNMSTTSYRFLLDIKYLNDLNPGSYYNWTVRAYDNTSYGANSTTFNFSISSSVIVSLVNDTVWFGVKNPLDYDDTTDNVPTPFEIINQGNSIINVNLSLLDAGLWNRKPSPTSYYGYKISNKSGKAGAFDFGASVTSWTAIPLSNTTSLVGLRYSNYSNINDTAIVDINITVPSDEPQGDKASRISFISQLA